MANGDAFYGWPRIVFYDTNKKIAAISHAGWRGTAEKIGVKTLIKMQSNPKDVVSIGQEIDVYVKSFDAEKGRVSLGYKTEESNPWTIFMNNYKVGDVVKVTVVSMTPFGAFAQIIPGVDGLIHISQIADKKLAHPSDVLKKGEEVEAKIIDINEEAHNVSLSIRALLEKDEEVAEEAPAKEAAEDAAEEVAETASETVSE